tara:strand:+ start:333 stop:1319 length:987 start_codon:yes stop_codon:yes gene_type:complete
MKNKPIFIISGEPYSVFLEIFFKIFKSKFFSSYKNPVVIIASKKLVELQMKKMKFSFKINLIKFNQVSTAKLYSSQINLIDVKLNITKPFGKISNKSSKYINSCFDIGIKLMKNKMGIALINGPVSKKHFLGNKFPGVTEYLAKKTKSIKKEVMLIYNKHLSVSPITTHVPLKNVHKKISTNKIVYKIKTINEFYKKNLNIKPRFAITGLNPHCESNFSNNEEKKIIKPALKILRKKALNIKGPYAADTLFIKKNLKKFDVIIGMYHDQVLTPLKTLYGFNAINLTLGLPFIRISPDHGPNNQMLGKKKSDISSLMESLIFIKKLNGN